MPGALGALQLAALPLLAVFTPIAEVQRAARVPSMLGAVLQLINGITFIGEGVMVGTQSFAPLAGFQVPRPPPRTHAPPGPPGRKTARRALRASRPAPRWATTRRVTRGEHATRGGRITRGGRARGSRCAAAGWQVLATVALIAALRLAPPGLNSVWACFFLFNGIRFFNVVRFHFFTGPLVAKNAR